MVAFTAAGAVLAGGEPGEGVVPLVQENVLRSPRLDVILDFPLPAARPAPLSDGSLEGPGGSGASGGSRTGCRLAKRRTAGGWFSPRPLFAERFIDAISGRSHS